MSNTVKPWISAAEWKVLSDYVRDVANDLGLRDWLITLMYKPIDDADDAWAMVMPISGRKHADLSLCSNWEHLRPEDKRHAIVHELLHCHEAPIDSSIRLGLPNALGRTAYDLFWEMYRNLREYTVDGLADAIAPLMRPYPEIKPPRK